MAPPDKRDPRREDDTYEEGFDQLRDAIMREFMRANRTQEELIRDLVTAIRELDSKSVSEREKLSEKIDQLVNAYRHSVPDGQREQLLQNLVEASLRSLVETHKNTVRQVLDELHESAKENVERTIQDVGTEYKSKIKEDRDLLVRVLVGMIAFLIIAVVAFVGIKLSLPGGLSGSPSPETSTHTK